MGGVWGIGEFVFMVEGDVNVLVCWVMGGIVVVFDVVSNSGVDGVVFFEDCVFVWVLYCIMLFVDDVVGNDILI